MSFPCWGYRLLVSTYKGLWRYLCCHSYYWRLYFPANHTLKVQLMAKKPSQSFPNKSYSHCSKLPADIQKLLKKAEAQTKLAYAPYSNFLVGAAILLTNGQIIGGCNQENASYPLCICAERVALYTYGARPIKHKIKALVVTAHNPSKPLTEVCMPCGACRQVIQEYEARQNKPIKVYVTSMGLDEIIKIDGINAILPSAFSQSALI